MAHLRSRSPAGSGAQQVSATRIAVAWRTTATRFTLVLATLIASAIPCAAGEITVDVVDRAGRGVPEVVVTLTPLGAQSPAAQGPASPAIMDQRDRAFVPRVLVVGIGTTVEFPNNDSVSHQVYSFSPAKRFQLPLYKGDKHPPVIFDREGLVVLGCNIHDEMAGYILVTGAPYFGKTDAAGVLELKGLPTGDYRLTLWSPLIADPPPSLIHTVRVDNADPTLTRVQLSRDLRARPEPRPRRGDWEY
jgi:plastocyanin